MWGFRHFASGLAAIVAVPGFAAAEGAIADRLGAVLTQERASLDAVPAARLDEIGEAQVIARASTAGTFPYDSAYLAGLPAASGGSQWYCLTEALYFEARGESVEGLFAVGEVILNRTEDPRFPGSVCGVVNEGTGRQFACQFTYTCDGRPEHIGESVAWDRVGKIARLLMDGAPRALTSGATHYHTHQVAPNWSRAYPRTTTVGLHHFYRWPSR
ncbi:cell wall hydrolase [Pelagovum pacificum]|uniref:Cell wall hydrolase n=1 Tax=Pelagovum pacificum TaxID=2588711 RepID=A0A5C5GGK7_9RHOB|nr:cell wall hydrolase [Pelagovum pacificum]QQA43720.1 cell wall hydrolase [Pelagovum pacificum]TNY33149.1 cell wall hydrolase [Pelagovum pacificum]